MGISASLSISPMGSVWLVVRNLWLRPTVTLASFPSSMRTVSVYAQRSRISLASPGAAAGAGGGAVINSEEFQADEEKFAAQHVKLYVHSLGRNSRAGELTFDQEKANSTALQAKLDSITCEHGDAYIEGSVCPYRSRVYTPLFVG